MTKLELKMKNALARTLIMLGGSEHANWTILDAGVVVSKTEAQGVLDEIRDVLKLAMNPEPDQVPASPYGCPACGKTLNIVVTSTGDYRVWCGYGPCQSQAANEGCQSTDLTAAIQTIERNVYAEEGLWNSEGRKGN